MNAARLKTWALQAADHLRATFPFFWHVPFWVFTGISLLIAIVFTAVVPFHQDEFIHYLLLRCGFHENLNLAPNDDCSGFWSMNLFGTGIMAPLRVYWYAGTVPAAWYLPLYLLWPSPLSARWLGVLFLLVQAGVLSRLFSLRFAGVFAGLLLLFPYSFQHLVDTGPIAFQVTSIYLLYYLFRNWCRDGGVHYAVAVGLIGFVGIWTKLVYVWYAPGLLVLLGLAIVEHRDILAKPAVRRSFIRQLLLALGIFFALWSVLLFSTDPHEPTRYVYLDEIKIRDQLSTLEVLTSFWQLDAFKVLTNPLWATHRIYHIGPNSIFGWLYSSVLFLALPTLLLLTLKRVRIEYQWAVRIALVFYGCFAATLFFIFKGKEVWAMHHVVLAFPFLVLSICAIAPYWKQVLQCSLGGVPYRRIVGVTLGVFILINVTYWLTFWRQPVRSESDASQMPIHHLLRQDSLAQRYIYVDIERGFYFLHTLYGHPDLKMVFRNPLKAQWQMDQLLEFKEQTGRSLLFVYDSIDQWSNYNLLRKNVATVPCKAVDPNGVWQVILEDNGDPNNPCL